MRIGLDDENSRMLPRFIQHEQARAPRYGDLGCGRAARARGSVKTTVTGESAGGRYGEAARSCQKLPESARSCQNPP